MNGEQTGRFTRKSASAAGKRSAATRRKRKREVLTLERVESRGSGAKLSRDEVIGIVDRLRAALDRDRLGRELF